MWFPSWLPRFRSRSGSRRSAGFFHRKPRKPCSTVRLMVEMLEGRVVPSHVPGGALNDGAPAGDPCDTFGSALQTLINTLPVSFDLPDLGWVWADPANRFRSVSGTVVDSGVTHTDFPFTHDSHDQNTSIAVDLVNHPEYADLLSPVNAPGEIEFEWETGIRPNELSTDGANPIFPKWAWPSVGDQVWVNGDWIYDCGHPVDGLFHTEIHPPRAIASMRDQVAVLPGPVTSPVRVTSTDLYIHGDGGYASDVLNDHDIITNGGSRTIFTPIDDDYTFDIPLPPKPGLFAQFAQSISGPGNNFADPILTLDPSERMVHVVVPLANSGILPTDVYARTINVGWQVPPPELHHLRLTLKEMNLEEQDDIIGDDELTFFWVNVNAASNEWLRLADVALGNMDDFGSGQTMTFDANKAYFDFYIAGGQADIAIRAQGYDQDGFDDIFGLHGPLAPQIPLLVAALTTGGGDNDPYPEVSVVGFGIDNGELDLTPLDGFGNPLHGARVYTLKFKVENLDPVLATLDPASGVLQLNMGPHAGERLYTNKTDGDEDFRVDYVSTESDLSETVSVSAFGFTQKFSGVRSIYAEGGEGNDTITIAPLINSPAELWGDFNPAKPKQGGFGNDLLRGGGGINFLHGGDGADQLFAGKFADNLDGGAGDDRLFAGTGPAQMLGGSGADIINWHVGDGAITVDGGADSDRVNLFGSNGPDVFTLSRSGQGVFVTAPPGINQPVPHLVLHAVEKIDVEAGRGADTITVNDLDTTGVGEVDVNLLDLALLDFAKDTVIVNGTPNSDTFKIQATKILAPGTDTFGGVTDILRGDFLVRTANVVDDVRVHGLGESDTFNILSLTGPTTVFAEAGSDTFRVFAKLSTD